MVRLRSVLERAIGLATEVDELGRDAWDAMRPIVEARRAVDSNTPGGITMDEWSEWEAATGAGALMCVCKSMAESLLPATYELPVHVNFPEWFTADDETQLRGFSID